MKTGAKYNNVVSEIIVISDDDDAHLLEFAKDDSVIIIDDHELVSNSKDNVKDTENCDYTSATTSRACSSKESKGLADITTNVCENRGKRKRVENKAKERQHNKRVKSGRLSDGLEEGGISVSSLEQGELNNQDETTSTYSQRPCLSKLAQEENIADSRASSNDRFHWFRASSCSTSRELCSDGPSTSGEGVTTRRRVIWDDDNPSNVTSTTTHVPQGDYSSGYAGPEFNDCFNCSVCQSSAQFTGKHDRQLYYNHFLDTHLLPYHVCTKCNVEFQGTGNYHSEVMKHFLKSDHKVQCPWCKAGKRERLVHQFSFHCEKKHLQKVTKGKRSIPIRCPHQTCRKDYRGVDRLVTHYLTKHERIRSLAMYFTCAQCGQRGLEARSAMEHYRNEHGAHFNKERLDYLMARLPSCTVWFLNGHAKVSSSTTEQPCQPKNRKVTLLKDLRSKDVPKRVNTNQNVSSSSSSNGSETSTETPTNTNELNLPCGPLQNLSNFSHIIFIDLDNWGKFFDLPYSLPSDVFVWGFFGGATEFRKYNSPEFQKLVREKRFFKHPRCGTGKNAADFALCVQAARLDLQLPMHIPFTVLSGDKGFNELTNQLASSARSVHLVNPHCKEPEILTAILKSIGEK